MIRPPPGSTTPDTLLPYTTLFLSVPAARRHPQPGEVCFIIGTHERLPRPHQGSRRHLARTVAVRARASRPVRGLAAGAGLFLDRHPEPAGREIGRAHV